MNNSKHQGNMNQLIHNMKRSQPVVEIKSFALAGAGMARVLVEVTHTPQSRADHNLVAAELKAKLDNRMAPVQGSFMTVESGEFSDRITGIVACVRSAVPVTEDNLKGFKAYASNMFMDDEKDIWVLRKTEAGQLLVKTTGIDDDITLVNLLDSVTASGFRNSPDYGRLTAHASSTENNVQGGDFVSYVTLDNVMGRGYVVATSSDSDDILVLPVGSDTEETVKRASVTEIHTQAEFPIYEPTKEEQIENVVATARGVVDISFLLEYYKKVYARSPAFFAQFADRLKKHQFC